MSTGRDISLFLTATEPWVVSYRGEVDELTCKISALQARAAGLRVIVLEGGKMVTLGASYDELARKLELPDYFGRNANALNECITDLDWLEAFDAVVLLVTKSDDVLRAEPKEMWDSFLDTLRFAGEEWARPVDRGEWWDRPAVPFHTVLACQSLDRFSGDGGYGIPELEL